MATQRQRKRLARRIQRARRAGTSSRKPQDPQIGYFAFQGIEVLCNGEGCVIAGSLNGMRRLLQQKGLERMTIKGTTFSEIWRGLEQGVTCRTLIAL